MEAVNKRNINNSAIMEHLAVCAQECGYSDPGVLWEESSILDQESSDNKRKAMESIHIRLAKDNVVNRDVGNLDKIWDRAIKICDEREGRWKKKRHRATP